jgi:Bacterial PH domain/Short C-terminal domain
MGDADLRPDIAAAKAKMRVKVGGGREIKRLTEYLWEGEQVERMTTGTYGKGTGLVILSDRRLLFVQNGIMSQTTEDFPLDKVSSIQWSSGMMFGTITVFASGNKAVITSVQKADGKEIVDLIRHRLSDKTLQAAPAATGGGGQDVYEQLRKLGELHTAGVLTDEEFEKKKAELLGRL